jgi:hypothetical protein
MNETPLASKAGNVATQKAPTVDSAAWENAKQPAPLPHELDNPWHGWINEYSTSEQKAGRPWLHSLYEFKTMLNELPRLAYWIRRARTGELPKVHQQCSHCRPEHIHENHLLCAKGVNVNECPILLSLRANVKQRGVSEDDADRLCGLTCAWHIFTTATGVKDGMGWNGIDTSEGYVQDASDRMFWSNVYESLASAGPDSEEADSVPNGLESDNASYPAKPKSSGSSILPTERKEPK